MSKIIKYKPAHGRLSKKEKQAVSKELKEKKQALEKELAKAEEKQQELSQQSMEALMEVSQFLRTLARKCILEKAELPQEQHAAVIDKHEKTWIQIISQINIMHPELDFQDDGFRNYVTKTLPAQSAEVAAKEKTEKSKA